jgi:trk system potassium uptake protein TrkA
VAQQFAVIGLGAFGTAIARELSRNGGEVIAVDKEMEPVERVKDEVAYAVRLDATDPKVLEAHELHKVDVAIIAIGHQLESIVLIAVELMQLGVKHIMARAENATQKRILERLGVPHVILPEEEVAKNVARRLVNPEILDLFRLSEDYDIVEVRSPERFLGKTLTELKLRERFRCNVIAIKRPRAQEGEALEPEYGLLVPLPQLRLEEGDTLIVMGLAKDIEQLTA